MNKTAIFTKILAAVERALSIVGIGGNSSLMIHSPLRHDVLPNHLQEGTKVASEEVIGAGDDYDWDPLGAGPLQNIVKWNDCIGLPMYHECVIWHYGCVVQTFILNRAKRRAGENGERGNDISFH